MTFCDTTFDAMGCEVRLVIGEPADGELAPGAMAEECRAFVHDFDARLSRFRDDSELCALNRDPRDDVPASELLREAVKAGLWAARRTDGLVDPTLVRQLEDAGYRASRADAEPAPLADALAAAPPRRPASPSPYRAWAQVEVDDAEGVIRRPAGIAFDTGGTGKGLAADLLARRLSGYSHFVVDCGGDLRVGGLAATEQPFDVRAEHPITGERSCVLRLTSGGVATSGLNVRLWRDADGRFAHHLLDPATGRPAWTGLVGATAIAPTALEAETLSKAALLSGPDEGRDYLAERGGMLIHETGRIELVGSMRVTPRITLPDGTTLPAGGEPAMFAAGAKAGVR